MNKNNNNKVAYALIGLGFAALLSSYALPVFGGVIFSDKIMHGWEVAFFTIAGLLNIFDGGLELILAGLFISNLVLFAAIILFFFRGNTFRYYKYILAVSLLYVLLVSILVLKPGTYEAGYYMYIMSFIIIGAALFMKSKQFIKK